MCDKSDAIGAETGAGVAEQLIESEEVIIAAPALSSRLTGVLQWMANEADKQMVDAYIAYVLRLVVILKFTITWVRHDDQSTGKKWKSEYLDAALKIRRPELFTLRDQLGVGTDARKQAEKSISAASKSFRRANKDMIVNNRVLLQAYRRVRAQSIINLLN
jgi:hypothetical protein